MLDASSGAITKRRAVALAAGLLIAQPGLAQQGAPASDGSDATRLEQLEVTGSRIRRTDFEGPTPVLVLDRTAIERIGLNDLGDIVRQLPVITGSPLSTRTNNGGDGSSQIDIRGLGTGRTLVLINGQRDVSGGDLSTIPLSMVDRIEVLANGASAVYGADAVAGVVNIITRRNYQGAEFTVHYSLYPGLEKNPAAAIVNDSSLEGSDGDNLRVSYVLGGTGGNGSFTAGLEYNEQLEVYQGNVDSVQMRNALRLRDLDDVRQAGLGSFMRDLDGDGRVGLDPFGGSSASLGGFFVVPSAANCPAFGAPIYTIGADGNPRCFEATDAYNFAPVNYLQTPFVRTNLFFTGEHRAFTDLTAYAEGRFASRRSEQALAPLPYFSLFDPPGVISADNVYNPFGEDITDARRRVAEVGARSFNQELNGIQLVTGLRGPLGFLPTWDFDLAFNFGRQTQVDTDLGQFIGARLANALGPSFDRDPAPGIQDPVCGTAGPDPADPTTGATIIDGCVPLNLFGGFGSITQEQLDYVSAALVDRTTRSVNSGQLVFRGNLVDLPAGSVATAFGYEYRRTKLEYVPDSGKATDEVTGNTGGPVSGKYDVNSVFTQIDVPILSGAPFADQLQIGLAARWDDYSTVGSATSFQATLTWQPVDQLLVRGSFTEVFKEPTIGQMFSPQTDSFPEYQDPCSNGSIDSPTNNIYATLTPEQQARCHAQGVPVGGYFQSNAQPRARIGGNPDVRPERGDTWTAGFVVSPESIEGLSFTVDYWSLNLEDAITVLEAETIVNQCIRQGDPESCSLIRRFDDAQIDAVIALFRNIGAERARGLDLGVTQRVVSNLGTFRTAAAATRLIMRESRVIETISAEGRFVQTTAGFARGVYPRWKGTAALDWDLANLGASLNIDYIGAVTENLNATLSRNIEAQYYVDANLRYAFPTGTRLRLGVNNIFDRDPPFIAREFNAFTDTDTYRPLGRQLFVTLQQDLF